MERRTAARASLHRLIEQFKKQRLIDFLSSQSWLPGFAFPQNVVKLLVRHAELNEKMRLERDREMGISVYAPARKSWPMVTSCVPARSGSILRNPMCASTLAARSAGRSPSTLRTQQPANICDRCGTAVVRPPKRYIKPDAFSTLAEDDVQEPGLYRRRPPRNSDVFLLEGAEDFADHPTIPGVSFGIRRNGKK